MAKLHEIPCMYCGNILLRSTYELKRHKHSFCNNKCNAQWKSQQAQTVEFICQWCGKIASRLRSSKSKMKFCNVECQKAWEDSKRIDVACANCGNIIRRPKSQTEKSKTKHFFCNMKCRREWQAKQRIKVSCHHCGKTIERPPNQESVSQTRQFFCDMDCLRAWEATTKITVTCEECGKKFERFQHHAESHAHQFCSQKCHGLWRGKQWQGENHPRWNPDRPIIKCDQCGKEFRAAPNQVDRNEHNFCCRKCYEVWSSLNLCGENHHSWKGGTLDYYGPNWHAQVRRARKRDGNRCRNCGKTTKQNGRAMDVHHIVPFREFGYVRNENDNYKKANHLSNLICLCQQCHAQAEAKLIPVQPNLL